MNSLNNAVLEDILNASKKGDFFELTGDDQAYLLTLVDGLSQSEQAELYAMYMLGEGRSEDFDQLVDSAKELGDDLADEILNTHGLYGALIKSQQCLGGARLH